MFDLGLISLLVSLSSLALGVVVLLSSRDLLNIKFFLFTLAISSWVGTVYLFEEYFQSLFLLKMQYSTGGLALILSLPWITQIVGVKTNKLINILIFLMGLLIVAVPHLGGLIIDSINLLTEGYTFKSGPLFYPYSAVLFLLILVPNALLFIKFKISDDKNRKSQLGLILIGLVLFSAASVIVNIILPIFNIKPVIALDAQSSIFWVMFSAYSITKHGLFNVKVFATQIFVGVILILIISRLIASKNLSEAITEGIILLLTIIFSYFLIRSVRNEVSRREEVEKLAQEKSQALEELEQRTKNLSTLQKISDIVLNESEMQQMTQRILDEIPKQLDGCVGAFLSVVKGKNLQAFSFSQNPVSSKIASLVGSDLAKYNDPIKVHYNLLHDALIEKNPKDSDLLSDFVSPPLGKGVARTLQTILGAKHFEAIPLYAGGEAFGVLLFVFSEDKDRVHMQNFEISRAIAGDMSLAIQRAQAFQKLKDANEYLAQLDKMKDEFISMASHELNTPLAAIEGYLSMILDEGMGKIDDKSREYLNRAYSSSKRLADLILDLLNVSRIEQGRLKMRFSQANLVELAESVVHELQIKADAKKLTLKIDADKAKLQPIWCDPDRIREVFVNLTGNALKFTEKGTITISIKQQGDKMVCSVTDTGRGIALEDQKKLFQKFSQVKREVDEHQGTGLGLYISKNFVELHNGTLSVKSEEGKGATFTFELPILAEAPKQVEGAMLDKEVSSPSVALTDNEKNTLPNIETKTISKGEVTTSKVT